MAALMPEAVPGGPYGYQRGLAVPRIVTKDGYEVYYKDWGDGPVMTFSRGLPLNAVASDGQLLFLARS